MKGQLYTVCIVGLCAYSLGPVDGKGLLLGHKTSNESSLPLFVDFHDELGVNVSKTTHIEKTVKTLPIQVPIVKPYFVTKPLPVPIMKPVPKEVVVNVSVPRVVFKHVPFEVKLPILVVKPHAVQTPVPTIVTKPAVPFDVVVKPVKPSFKLTLEKHFTVHVSKSTEKKIPHQQNVSDHQTTYVEVKNPEPIFTYPTETTTYMPPISVTEKVDNYVPLENNGVETVAGPSDEQGDEYIK